MKALVVSLFAFFWMSSLVADQWRFHMDDGSVVVGEMTSLVNGVYTLHSPSMGRLRIKESNIRSMVRVKRAPTPSNTPAPTTSKNLLDAVPDSLKAQLLSDPFAMRQIYRLQGHPALPRVLSNPAVLDAIKRGDFQSLKRDPAVQQLLRDPGMQQLISRLSH